MKRFSAPSALRVAGGESVLSLLLAAALLAPLVSGLQGRRVTLPAGLELRDLTVAAVVGALGWIGWRGVVRALPGLVATALLAAAFAHVLERRANLFFTVSALLEGMAALLLLHALAIALRLVGEGRAPSRRRLARWMARRRVVTAGSLARGLTAASALLVVGFWALSVLALREYALPLLMGAGVTTALTALLRVPDAVMGAPAGQEDAHAPGEWRAWARRGTRHRRDGGHAPTS